MIHNWLFRIACGLCLVSLCSVPLLAQGTFSLASSAATGADIGVAEMTGQLKMTVVSGTTIAESLFIQYSAPITTNFEVQIWVRGTGGLAGVAAYPHLLRSESAIVINIPAGGSFGDTITVQGVRVALAGGNFTDVKATVTFPAGSGNGIAGGLNTVTVLNSILKPFTVDLTPAPPLSFTAGAAVNSSSSITIVEGYPGAFTADVGIFGQTTMTSIRVTPYPTALPPGVSVTLAAVAASGSGGWLTTESGQNETIPREDGTVAVVYDYSSESGPKTRPQSFTISVSLSLDGTASPTGVVNFQCELLPIGIAVPDTDFPSTAIPRYSERLVPDPTQLPGVQGSVFLSFPFRAQSDGIYTGIALTNTLDAYVDVILTPFDSSGAPILAPKTVTIPPKGQIAKLATDVDIFGPNFNAGKSGTILAEGNTPILPGFYLLGDFNGSRLDGATAEMNPLQSWVLPVIFRQAPAPFTIIEMFNSNTVSANASLKLMDAGGRLLNTANVSIPASGTVTQNVQQLFPGVDFGSFSGGYVKGTSDAPLIVRETFGNALDSNVLPAQLPKSFSTAYWAHFATGGGLNTDLTFVNDDQTMAANVRVTAYNSAGVSLGQAQVVVPISGQTSTTIAQLFPSIPASPSTVGYVQVDNIPTQIGPFLFAPAVTAALRFSAANGSGSAALPLSLSPLSEFVYAHAVETAGYYTGIAILNKNAAPASVSVDVYTNAGILLGTGTLILQPGEKIAKLLHELVPTANGQQGGYIHIKSDQPVMSLSIFGSNDGLSLSAIPPQNIVLTK